MIFEVRDRFLVDFFPLDGRIGDPEPLFYHREGGERPLKDGSISFWARNIALFVLLCPASPPCNNALYICRMWVFAPGTDNAIVFFEHIQEIRCNFRKWFLLGNHGYCNNKFPPWL
jgi:hypothetical protein